ncbi:M50 family metallopeptidase [Paenibacillus abyssi]|uniref:M50 family peptidase n=1 Tax=Paenibacillus abyssi TaxID=1340531 RepID=A0A917D0J2_9BACL|nr:M50 family metallopeptidase [Paenibacillus abyssi]GGG04674.1 hypothetical protein GCM10010916_22150 [Paenibacillus abyssi]
MKEINKWFITVVLLIATGFLTRLLPFSTFFRTLDTMIHEFGHAIMTLLSSGRVLRIELNADHSGVTYSLISSSWSVVAVTLMGYVTASLFAVLMFYLYAKRNEKLGLCLISLMGLLMLIFFVHEGFGVRWLIGFVLLNGIAYLLGRMIRSIYYLLLAFITLEESVLGPIWLMILSVARTQEAGDAFGLQQATGIPAFVWAMLFMFFSLFCARIALRYFFERLRKSDIRG